MYTYNYQVADDDEQTYITQTESRDGAEVNGEYKYVDPYGHLVTVTYVAGPMGYSETRSIQENFVRIRARPQRRQQQQNTVVTTTSTSNAASNAANFGTNFGAKSTESSSSSTSSSTTGGRLSQVIQRVRPAVEQVVTKTTSTSASDDGDLVARILAQLTPFIRQTVSG